MSRIISAGHENSINSKKVIAIVNASSAPTKRLIKNAKDTQMIIDATEGNKTLSAIVMESGHVVLSAVRSETLRRRVNEPIVEK